METLKKSIHPFPWPLHVANSIPNFVGCKRESLSPTSCWHPFWKEFWRSRAGKNLVHCYRASISSELFWPCKSILNCLSYFVLDILLSAWLKVMLIISTGFVVTGNCTYVDEGHINMFVSGNNSWWATECHDHDCNSLLALLQLDSQYSTTWVKPSPACVDKDFESSPFLFSDPSHWHIQGLCYLCVLCIVLTSFKTERTLGRCVYACMYVCMFSIDPRQ